MTKEIKKLKKYQQPLGIYFLSPKRILFFLIAIFIFTIFAFETIDTKVFAATGINRTINFQGKVVNKDGTNVADGQYTFVFKLYDASSGGANPWTETQNNVQVTAGIFRVSLGSVTTFASAGVDFNTDNLYLAINFNSDGEMTPRVRFAAVPYAINAEKVAGLTVTDTTGTLTIPNSKTVQFGGAFTTSAQDLTLTLGGATNVTLPTTGTLATLAGTENLSNKSFTSTLTFSGVTTDITTGTNESLTISPNGVGNVMLQSQSGGQSALIIDKTGLGDIFAASASGVSRFVIKTDGTASSSAGFTVDGVGSVQSTRNQTLTLGGGSTGNLVIGRSGQVVTLGGFDCSGSGNGGKLTTTSGGVLTCASDGGGTSSYSPFQESTIFGTNYQVNTTEDFLIGGVATTSAKFAILNVAGARGAQTASISGNIVLDAAGTIQTTLNQTLTIGGDTTGDLILKSSNAIVFRAPGTANIFVGSSAGVAGLAGTNNVVLGGTAGNALAAGSRNTLIGDGAGQSLNASDNTFVGRISGSSTTGGTNNAFFGNNSGSNNAGGSYNTFIGYGAATVNTEGLYNTVVGTSAEVGSNSLTNANAFGTQSVVAASNSLVLGGTGLYAVQVGIGTTTPISALNVVGGQKGGNAAFILNQIGNTQNDIFAASSSGVTKFVIKNDGTASSSAGFTVDGVGNVQSTRFQTLTLGGGSTGNLILGRTGQVVTLPGFDCSGSGNGGKLTTTSGGVLTCSADGGGAGGSSPFQESTVLGINYQVNTTEDFLIGGVGTTSAKFAILNVAGGVPTASISAGTAGGVYLTADGRLSATANQSLVIGGDTTGGITLTAGVANQASMTIYKDDPNYPHIGIGTTSNIFAAPYVALQVDKGNILVRGGDNFSSGPAYIFFGDAGNYVNAQTGEKLSLQGYHGIKFNAGSTPTEYMTLSGTGLLGLGATSPVAKLQVAGSNGSNAAFILDQLNNGDIFAASSAGVTKLVIKNDGTASSSAGFTVDGVGNIQSTRFQTLTVGGGSTGNLIIGRASQVVTLPGFDCSGSGNGGKLTTTTGGVLTCAADGGGTSSYSPFQESTSLGINYQVNTKEDFLIGGVATDSAKFAILGVAGDRGTQTASISGNIVLDAAGSLQTTLMQNLTLGGDTTGNIYLRPRNSLGLVNVVHGEASTGGLVLTSNLTDSTSKQGRLKSLHYLSAQPPVTAILMVNGATDNQLWLGGGSASENSATKIRLIVGANNTTLTGNEILQAIPAGIGIGDVTPLNLLDVDGAAVIGDGYAGVVTAPTNGLLVEGFVGLGTGATPVAPLDILNNAVDINGQKLALRRTGAGDVGLSFQQNGVSAFGIVNRSGSGNGLAFVDNYYEGSNGTEIARFYASSGVGIGTLGNIPAGTLDVRGVFSNSGIQPIATLSGTTSFAGLVIDNSGTGDLFTASSSSNTQFVIKTNGSVGIGGDARIPTAYLDVAGNASISSALTFRTGAGSIQTSANNTLTLGGNTTGNILLSPSNNLGRGTVGIGPTPAGGWMGNLYISGDYGGKALTILNSTSGTQDIFTASASGTSRFSITNSGGIKLGASEGSLGQCLMSNGAGSGATWGGCAAGGNGWWNLISTQGTLVPVNTTLDMLWGGISTSSATFHLFGSINSGTTPVASISANSSFAGLVIDQKGTGDFLTASASGVTKFTITKSGGIYASDGLTINKTGSNDIVKTTSGNNTTDTDFQRTANATSATITNLDNTGGELSLSKGTVSSDGTITTSSQPVTPGALGAGASSITNSTGRYMVIRGGGTTTLYLYNSLSNSFQTATSVTSANVGAGSVTIPRPDGKYLVVHGGGVATTSVIDPNDNVPGVAGPTATGNNGAGTNIYRRQNGQYLLLHGAAAGTTRVYNPVANTFAAGPTAGGTTWGAGSLVLPRQNGTALIVAGGASANTQLYNLDGAAGIGSFTAGPVLPTNCEINNAGSVALQLANGRYIILSKAGVSVEYDPVTNTMGTCQNVGPAGALADGAHAIRLQDRRFLIYRGSGTTDAYIYNPATNTYSTHATATSTQGAGLHSLQKHDGTWMTFVGGSTTTNKYDSQLVMSGSYVSEDINTNSLNPSSSLWFTAGAEALFVGTSSATATTDLPQSGLEISVQTASTQGGLSSATERRIYRNGDPIRAEANDKWIRITANFTRPIPQQIYDERRTWVGNGMTNIIRDYQDPTLYDYMIDNSTVFFRNNFDFVDSQGIQDPTEASSSAFTRVQPMADRITLPWGKVPGPTQISTNGGMYLGSIGVHPPLLAPTADGTLVIQRPGGLISIIASGSANMNLYDPASSQFTAQSGAGNIPTASTGRGAFALKLPNGKFFIVLGNGTSTTNIYDPNAASGSQFVAGPTLSGVAGFGAQPILNKDGTYTILHGGGLTTSTLFNPYTDPIKPSTVTLPVGPVTTIAINCGSWAIPLSGQLQDTYRVSPGVAPFIAGLTTSMTYDSVAKVFTAGPTQTGAHGCGSYAFQRQDGYWVSVAAAGGTTGAQSTATQIINPWSNTNGAGATLTAAVGRGSVVIPRADGTFLITRGQAQTGNGNGSNIYIPWGGTFIVGGPTGTSVAGPNLIDYAATPGTAVQGTGSVTFQRPDGKWVIIAGGQVTGSAIVNLYDAGWYPDGQYQSGQIYAPTLTTSSTMSWKKSSDDFVSFEVRTSPTREAMLTASYDSVSRSGDTIAADSGDKWAQIQINFSRRFLGYDGIYKDSWPSTGAYPALVVSQPTVFEYRINNAYDFLTLKNDGLNVFRVNKYGAVYSGIQGGFYTGGADLAENYSSKEALAKGEVVSIDGVSGDHNIKKSSGQYQSDMLGVVSTNPGFVAGDGTEDAYPVALVGRVPVKVSTENGPIREGDALTSASIPGYAMKATVGGRVLGRALHSFDESTAESCPALGMGNFESTKCGTLMLFVNLVDFNGESVNVAMSNAGFTLNESELPAVAGIDFSEGTDARKQQEILGFLKTQKDNGQGIYTDRVSATQEIISPQIVTDLLIAKKIKAESIEGLEIITNSIETLSNRISTGSAVTNFSDRITLLAHNQDQFQEQMASIAARLEKMDNLNLLTMTNISSGEGQLTTVANLAVFNTATFAQASVLDNLQVGNNMTLSMNAINTVGADLEIQSLRQGAVSFLGGLIRFDTDGKVAFAEDVSFQKNVAVTGVLSAHTVATTDLQLAQGTTTVLTDTEVDSTAAAGLVTLKRGTDHMKINNPLVKENSFIFITPKTKTNQNLFLLDQKEAKDEEEGSFTVGVDAKATDDIKFNYLIVN